MQEYLSRNKFDSVLEVHALNKRGDIFTWKTNVLESISTIDSKEIEKRIRDRVLITLEDISVLTWNISKSLEK
jgi:hypothetical protein